MQNPVTAGCVTPPEPSLGSAPVRVLVVDDHPVLRKGVVSLINQEPDLKVCAETESAGEAVDLVIRQRPQVAVIDLALRCGSGLELVKNILSIDPGLPILVLSMFDEERYAERALRAGSRGYMMKSAPPDALAEAIRRVVAGDVVLSDAMRERVIGRIAGGGEGTPRSGVDSLDDREMEVFRLLGEGRTLREIGETLHLSCRTIETYREKIKEKLGLQNARDLLSCAYEYMRTA